MHTRRLYKLILSLSLSSLFLSHALTLSYSAFTPQKWYRPRENSHRKRNSMVCSHPYLEVQSGLDQLSTQNLTRHITKPCLLNNFPYHLSWHHAILPCFFAWHGWLHPPCPALQNDTQPHTTSQT